MLKTISRNVFIVFALGFALSSVNIFLRKTERMNLLLGEAPKKQENQEHIKKLESCSLQQLKRL